MYSLAYSLPAFVWQVLHRNTIPRELSWVNPLGRTRYSALAHRNRKTNIKWHWEIHHKILQLAADDDNDAAGAPATPPAPAAAAASAPGHGSFMHQWATTTFANSIELIHAPLVNHFGLNAPPSYWSV